MNTKTGKSWALVLALCGPLSGLIGSGFAEQPPADIQFSTPTLSVVEDSGTALVTVLRTGNTDSAVTVDYATNDSTAKAGADYVATAGTLQFAAGETNKTIRIVIMDDGLLEGDETLSVALANPTGGAVLGQQKATQLTILDNELRPRLLDIGFQPDATNTPVSSLSVARQSDGRILLAGTFYIPDVGPMAKIVRLNPDGSQDPQFKFTGQPTYTTLALAPLPDGKVLIGGSFTKVGAVARRGVARLTADGTLDQDFDPGLGPAGILNQDSNARVTVLAVQPDGKAVIGGVFSRFNGLPRSGLARLNTDGSVDTNFNARINVEPDAITVRPDGKLVVVGGFDMVNGVAMTYIARFNTDGTTDPTFHAKFATGGSLSSVAIQPDGKMVIAGGFSASNHVARLNSDGTVDGTFKFGQAKYESGIPGIVFTAGLQTDGKIIISGSFSTIGGVARMNFARLLPDGSLDASFDLPVDNFPSVVLVQPDDDILVGGNFSIIEGVNRSGLVRVHGDLSRAHPVEFIKASYIVGEGAGEAAITLRRKGETSGTVSVDYATSDVTAIAGIDYIAQSGTVTFAPLEVTKDIFVPVLAGALIDDDKKLNLHLSNPSSGAQLGEVTAATLTIRNDAGLPKFMPDSLYVDEGAGLATVTLRRRGDLTASVTLDYATGDGTAAAGNDYVPQKGTITFAPGTAVQTIQIPILDNGSVNVPKTVNVTVSNPAVLTKPSTATLTILDNEQPVLFDPSFVAAPATSGNAGDPCVLALLAQPDGKVVMGGCFTEVGGLSRNGIARLNHDGSLDTTFDPGSGLSAVGTGYDRRVAALAAQQDGKIILGGSFVGVGGHTHRSLARLNPNGEVDETFQAEVVPLGGAYPTVSQVLVQADDKILFSGYSMPGIGVARLNANGSADTTFHAAHPSSTTVAPFTAITLQPDGKILAGGSSFDPSGFAGLIRLNADGSLDNTFAFLPPAALGAGYTISSVAVQADGKVLAGGTFGQSTGSGRGTVLRLNSNGSLDQKFGGGYVQDVSSTQLFTLADGKVLAWGPGGVRLNGNGSLDRYFSLNVGAAAVQPDGFIVVAGTVAGSVARIFPEVNQPGGPEFIESTVSVIETIGAVVLNVQRLGDSSQAMTVDFATKDLTATAGIDYVAQHGTLRFAALQVTNSLSIPIINDDLVDEPKSFQVTLSNPSPGATVQRVQTATVIITSNDTGIQFASDTFKVNEAAGFAEVLVTRSGDGLGPAAVDYSTSDGIAQAGADYLARTGTITFASGETGQTIQIPLLDDGAVEGDETIHLTLTNPRAGAMLGAQTNATLVIHDNEISTSPGGQPDIFFSATDSSESESAGLLALTVQRSGDTSQPATVQYATQDGTAVANLNYVPTSGTLAFGPLENEKSIILPLLDDGLASADTVMSVALSHPSAGTVLRAGLSTTTVRIADSHRPGSIDPTFHPIIETTNASTSGFRMALQTDGKLIVAGGFQRVNGVSRHGICRLNPDGTLDASFDPLANLAFQQDDWNVAAPVYSLLVQADAKILVRGFFDSVNGLNYTNFVRFNPDGSVDTSFVADPAATLLNPFGHGAGMAVQSDGKILVSEAGGCCGVENAELARLTANGAADPTFVTLEVVGVNGGWGSTFQCIVVEQDGRTLFEGNTDSIQTYSVEPQKGLTRLNTDGRIDESFHPIMDKLVAGDFGSRTFAVVQPDGKIVTVGFFRQVNGMDRPGLARLNPDGSTDASFKPETPNNDTGTYHITALALQADGKIVAADADGSIVRFNADGLRDPTFELNGRPPDPTAFSIRFSELIVQPDGQILVAMLTSNYGSETSTNVATLMRLNGDRELANSRARFRSIARAATGKVQLKLDVVPNRTYSIEASPDLAHWTSISARHATNYFLNDTDSALGNARRFYRAVQTAP